jgi:nucleoside diphosphate kinase
MHSSDPQTAASSPIVFVFFDPWTLVTGRYAGMVERILEQGFRLLDFEFKTLSEADAEEIYRTNHPIREGNSWHVARLVYPMGRSLGLLFGMSDRGACACTRMQRLKGKANPCLNRPGQLRHDFLSPNKCLSLMHSSDTLAQVRREAPVFFAPQRIDTALVAADKGGSSSEELLDELTSASAEAGIERIEEPGLGTLFARIRLRLVRELQRACPTLSHERSSESYRALWKAASRNLQRLPVITEAQDYLRLLVNERPLVAAMTEAVTRATAERTTTACAEYYRPSPNEPLVLVSCLQILQSPQSYSRWDTTQQLPPAFLYDRWEQLLFRTHLFNFDDMLSPGATA